MTRELSDVVNDATKQMQQFCNDYRRYEQAKQRHDRYFWKAYPIIQNDPELLESTLRREEEHRST